MLAGKDACMQARCGTQGTHGTQGTQCVTDTEKRAPHGITSTHPRTKRLKSITTFKDLVTVRAEAARVRYTTL
jgi:hypothetical protein